MLTGEPHQAQDLVQETMVRVQLNWRRVARADSPERYVRRMLTNQYVDWRRGSWVRRVLLRGESRAGQPRPVMATCREVSGSRPRHR
ncbi:sigma factor [Micromonospora zamorensis]|uniref:sigma factor n=1 Tax=Micromonospora zamorensis TaxID=709883 RepID=UPI0036775FB4